MSDLQSLLKQYADRIGLLPGDVEYISTLLGKAEQRGARAERAACLEIAKTLRYYADSVTAQCIVEAIEERDKECNS